MNPYDVVKLARSWASGWEPAEIGSITWCGDRKKGGLWYPPHAGRPSRIELGSEEGIELVYHEAFHATWHGSPLAQFDPWWGEGFCNAFSETSRNVFYPYLWLMGGPTTQHERVYLHPCHLLCRETLWSAPLLRDFFRLKNQEALRLKRPVLSEHFGWSPDPAWSPDIQNGS